MNNEREPIQVDGNNTQAKTLQDVSHEVRALLTAHGVAGVYVLVMPGNAETLAKLDAPWSTVTLDDGALCEADPFNSTEQKRAETVNAMRLLAHMLEIQAEDARKCADYLTDAYGFEVIESGVTKTAATKLN